MIGSARQTTLALMMEFRAMTNPAPGAAAEQPKPLIPESSTSESTSVEVVMNDMKDKTTIIPEYQRDGDQWDDITKSLFVESVINNLTIPAFFFEVILRADNVEVNEVVDGQQRLTTMQQFFNGGLRLVGSDDAPYLSPNSVHYAGRTFAELPAAYQQAFKKYRLTVIKLRNLKDMKLEVFRRINQGGTPLSPQDIRLAYFGGSPSVTLVRLVGVYDLDRAASKRFLQSAQESFGLKHPWTSASALEAWKEWWQEKESALGQTASEMFLWSFVSAHVAEMDKLLQNTAALSTLKVRFNRTVAEALDACCAQLRFQDQNEDKPYLLGAPKELGAAFFPFFESWFGTLFNQKTSSIPVSKHRLVAAVIGAAYRHKRDPKKLSPNAWTNIVEFIRGPTKIAAKVKVEYPASRGRWDGAKGARAQLEATNKIVEIVTA